MSSYTPQTYSPEYLAESRVTSYLLGCIIPWAIATVFMLARFYSRAILLRQWGWDDSLLMSAWLGSVIIFALDLALIPTGIGKHIQTTSRQDGIDMLRYAFAVKLVYITTLALTKLAIARFYLRIFTDRLSRRVIWAILGWTLVTTGLLIIMVIFHCRPVSDAWKLVDANCPVDGVVLVSLTGAFNIVGDLALIGFVVPKIYTLKMHTRHKIVLLLIVLTSSLVVVAAVIRLIISVRTVEDFDQSWIQAEIGVWSVVEVNVGIFAASILAIKPLIRQVYPKLLSSLPYYTSSPSESGGSGSRSTSSRKWFLFGSRSAYGNASTLHSGVGVQSHSWNQSKHHHGTTAIATKASHASSDTDSVHSQAGIVRTTEVSYAHEPLYEMERKNPAEVGVAVA